MGTGSLLLLQKVTGKGGRCDLVSVLEISHRINVDSHPCPCQRCRNTLASTVDYTMEYVVLQGPRLQGPHLRGPHLRGPCHC